MTMIIISLLIIKKEEFKVVLHGSKIVLKQLNHFIFFSPSNLMDGKRILQRFSHTTIYWNYYDPKNNIKLPTNSTTCAQKTPKQ